MATATLRRVGGSIVMAVPRKILSLVDLGEGSKVSISVDDGRLVIAPDRAKRHTLAELLRKCRRSDLAPRAIDRAWLDSDAVGNEEI